MCGVGDIGPDAGGAAGEEGMYEEAPADVTVSTIKGGGTTPKPHEHTLTLTHMF